MHRSKRRRLKESGWRVGNAEKFLELTPQESAYVELKLALSRRLQQRRRRKKLTQVQLATVLRSSQSRVAKMEAGDPSVSLDLLVRALIALGVRTRILA